MNDAPKASIYEIIEKLTEEQRRLLYMIGLYTALEDTVGTKWLKELSVTGLILKGTRDKVFDYDYAPSSVMYQGTRKVLNISQEGQNDLNALREYGLLARLRLGTTRHFYFNAYGLTFTGVDVFNLVPQEDRTPIEKLVRCAKCGKLYEVVPEEDSIYMTCASCDVKINTEVDDIEDVAYMCSPKWLKIKLIGTEWKPIDEED